MFRPVPFRSLLIAVAALTATAAHAEPKDGTQFKDWTVSCETVTKGDAKTQVCNLNQDFSAGEPKHRLLQVAVTYLPGKPQPFMVLIMPLGMALPPGVQLQVDDGEKVGIPVNTCLPDGCRAGGAIGDDLLAALKKGTTLNVTFADLNLKALTAPISLSGFTAGLTALK